MNSIVSEFYLALPEPAKSSLLALRQIILKKDAEISESWKYGMPFFCYHGKMFCYLWIDRKSAEPYLGIVDGNKIAHRSLVKGSRSRMKILPLDTDKDLPLRVIDAILKQAIDLAGKKARS